MANKRSKSGKLPLRNILDLSDRLTQRGDLPGFMALDPGMRLSILAAPAATAHIILCDQPAWPERLSVLIAGASSIDRFNSGTWYSLVPFVIDEIISDLMPALSGGAARPHLGLPIFFDITFVGPDFDDHSHGDPDLAQKGHVVVREFSVSLGKFLSNHANRCFDLAILFQPGFEEHGNEWLVDKGLKSLADGRAKRIFMTSYAKDEQQRDRAFLREKLQFHTIDFDKNPWSLPIPELCDSGLETYWGGYVTEVTPKVETDSG